MYSNSILLLIKIHSKFIVNHSNSNFVVIHNKLSTQRHFISYQNRLCMPWTTKINFYILTCDLNWPSFYSFLPLILQRRPRMDKVWMMALI